MGWRETWRETVESFLREVRDPGEAAGAGERSGGPTAADSVVAAEAAEE